ncbi:uncharacterized protein TRIADDRAFT_58011 [Trichoplax adhaerens]|uniref:Translation initiation factor eIF2B subunit gamma n=1 Tax=Trichoplax adhaerens TaxID=10228 RepID=B3S2F9_TRIAD|nr:hypothetical protein TRIADDRAFT_58011 [Trichoplax adhaerens]EDV23090.1 hypothetical protein TRIADDRAFT_58011 [Trichoplax adhaerens]|eukprot:XP_002114000.1 hypothetical protein TRIADDRAFT_58011 [Trichoplax adhaerens]
MEFQAVILAAGPGSRMYPLTENMPKALLPVANKPMIWYPIRILQKAGFEEIFIIVLKSQSDVIKKSLVSCNLKCRLHYVQISDEEEVIGTAESLRKIRDKVKNDLMILSCDLITNLELHRLANIHRIRDSDLTAFMYTRDDSSNEAEGKNKKKKKKEATSQCDFVGVSEKDSRLVFLSTAVDVHKDLAIKRNLFMKYPRVLLRTDLIDAHLYLVKKWILDFLIENKSYNSFKGEVLPHLVYKLDARPEVASVDTEQGKEDNTRNNLGTTSKSEIELEQLALSLSTCYRGENIEEGYEASKCYTYISDKNNCIRVNSVQLYMDANRHALRWISSFLPEATDTKSVHFSANTSQRARGNISEVGDAKTGYTTGTSTSKTRGSNTSETGESKAAYQSGPSAPTSKSGTNNAIVESADAKTNTAVERKVGVDQESIIGDGVTIENKCAIKKSVIGNHCRILDNVKILNSVLMDHVTVESGCVIQNSVVCSLAHIKGRCTIKDCQIGYSHTVSDATEANGECLVSAEGGMMTLDNAN